MISFLKKEILLLALAIVLPIAQSNCQTAATLLANVTPSGGTIATAGSYYLGFDVTGNIVINASNVILDLNAHVVNGAITASGMSNVTIMNGNVHNPQSNSTNITISACDNVQLNNLTLTTDVTSGVICSNSTDIAITNVIVYNNTQVGNGNSGIRLIEGCSNAKINNCVINGVGRPDIGIDIQGSSNIVIQNCVVVGARFQGYKIISDSRAVTVIDCFACDTREGEGFLIDSANDSVKLIGCIATGNGADGFHIADGQQEPVTLEKCMAHYNSGDGVEINDGNEGAHLVKQCVAIGNLLTGFSALNSDNGAFIGNFSDNNQDRQYDPHSSPPMDPINANVFDARCIFLDLACFKRLVEAHYWRNVLRPIRGSIIIGGLSVLVCGDLTP